VQAVRRSNACVLSAWGPNFPQTKLNLGYLEPKARHATPVLVHHTLALLLSVVAGREQHALVASGFLVFAHAARLG